MNGIAPVSYTHLDVYKRQDWLLLGLLTRSSEPKVVKWTNFSPEALTIDW